MTVSSVATSASIPRPTTTFMPVCKSDSRPRLPLTVITQSGAARRVFTCLEALFLGTMVTVPAEVFTDPIDSYWGFGGGRFFP